MIVTSEAYDHHKRKQVIDALCKKYPFISYSVIGKSCVGRDIIALKVGKAASYSLFAAAFHGSEHITSNILLYFAEELCEALGSDGSIAGLNARKALFGRGVIFVPCVNPDGCEISIHGSVGCSSGAARIGRLCENDFTHWNANYRGVDINHNFDAGWKDLHERERRAGITGPAPTRFGGYAPESEPETVALTSLCRENRIHHVAALHSQGEVIYWSYGDKKPNRSEHMAQIMATASGYALDVPVGMASGGGFKDWFIESFNRPGFTIELGRGKNPLDPATAYSIYETARKMLTLCAIM